MPKKVLFDKEALDKMLHGLGVATRVVAGTIGPKGRNVYYEGPYGPGITNDGVKAGNEVILADKQEDAGAYIIRNVTAQQLEDVGDGTTTAAILTHAIITESLRRYENPMEIRASLRAAGEKVLKRLVKGAVKLKSTDVEKVALISAEDSTIAKLIAEIITKLGPKAVINVEDSKTFATDYEIVDGYEASAGFMSPHFINDKSGKAIYRDVPVVVSEKKISNVQDIKSLFEQFNQNGITSCVFVCDDIDDSIMGILVANKVMGKFHSLVIKASAEVLRDIAGTTGATTVSDRNGVTFQNITLDHLGKAKKVVADASKSLFIGDSKASLAYSKVLDKEADNEANQFLKKRIEDRAAKLRGGIAILRIGAPTDQDRGYLKDKADDAVKATLAALSEGVVAGGGMALWLLGKDLKDSKEVGEWILARALEAPLKAIIQNAGKDYVDVAMKMLPGHGYDAKNDTYVNMIENGIIDPCKVTRCALENAVSASSTFITTFAIITENDPIKPNTT